MAKTARDAELGKKEAIRTALLKTYIDIEKGFTDQRERCDQALDLWDAFHCKLGEKQFYSGNSQIFLPFIHDAVDARKTRFTNQMFPQSGRFVEVTTPNGDIPHETMALLEHYVRWNDMRARIVRPLVVNGDLEGQYSVYLSWKSRERYVGSKVQKAVESDGLPIEEAGKVDDFEESVVTEAGPWVDIIADAELFVWPLTADNIDDALDMGGGVAILRRWSRAQVKRMIKDGEFIKSEADSLVSAMDAAGSDVGEKPNVAKKLAEAAGIKAKGKFVLGYEVWTKIKVDDEMRTCRVYYGGDKIILGCKLNPYWCDLVPVLSGPVERAAGVFKGRAPAADVLDLQLLANDTINEGADTAHFSAMPIIMTDPEKNPKINSMVLGLAAVWETSPQSTQFAQFPELWRSAFERSSELKQQIFQTLGVNPAMIPNQKGKQKTNQAEIANEQQVDLLTTADAVTIIEEQILTPILQRFAAYDHQFRNDVLLVESFGEVGQKAIMQEIEPQQENKRYSFRWFGVEAARNAAQMQQQIAGLNVVKEIPPQLYSGYKLNLAPMMVQMFENLFGPRLAPQLFSEVNEPSVDPMIENHMLEHGFEVMVHPGDDDQQHMMVHMQIVQGGGDHHGTARKHLMLHQQQMMQKAAAQSQQAQGGPPQQGGGGPAAGGQAGVQTNVKNPPGSINPDQMAAAGGIQSPRQ